MTVVELNPIQIDDEWYTAIDVELPKTRLLAIRSETGYVMCGALDVELLRTRLMERNILAARATGVKSIQDLLNGTVESCTQAAESIGIQPGMSIKEALGRMRQHETGAKLCLASDSVQAG